ncbi:MAG: trigger factor [Negativicutes bacterium]|nr:trigger factor [Negativicutes bacterium]
MKVTAEKIDAHKTVLVMEIPQPEVAKAVDRACQKLAAKVNIPGFRKGKVPRKILEMRLGKEAILDEAFDLLAPGAYAEALKEHAIEPVSRPEIELVTLQEDQPLVFKATVIVKPEITLGEYKGLKVKKPAVEVSADDVAKQIENLRNRNAKMVVVEDAALQSGDFAIIDFDGFVDGAPFKGGDAKGYPLEVGSGSFIPGFEEQLIGAKSGEEREVKVTFPADYFVAELAGKEAQFKVKINDVKRKELPEIDDEFVKEVSEVNTVEELKADLENKLKQSAEQKTDREFRNGAVKAAVANVTVDVPDVMVESQIDNMLQDMDVNLQNRGMSLAKYMEYAKTDMATLRQNYRESALDNVKTDLMLAAIAKAEGLEVTPEELEAEIAVMAAGYQAPVEEVRKIIMQEGRQDSLIKNVLTKKAAELIIDSAVAE